MINFLLDIKVAFLVCFRVYKLSQINITLSTLKIMEIYRNIRIYLVFSTKKPNIIYWIEDFKI